MGLFNLFKKQNNNIEVNNKEKEIVNEIKNENSIENIKEEFNKWLDETLNTALPNNIEAICFILYEDPNNKWSIELVGAGTFSETDEDWACDEVFTNRDNPFVITYEGEWEKIEEIYKKYINDYLNNNPKAEILKKYKAVGMCFADGDLTILYKK